MIKKGTLWMKAGIVMVGCGLLLGSCGKKKDDSETRTAPPIEVAEATTDSITLYKSFPGTITAATDVQLLALVTGRLLKTNFTPGTYVHKGQVLYTIDPTLYQDEVARAEATLATARSQHEFYTRQYEAMKKALAVEAVSKMEVFQAQSTMEQAAASIRDAEAALRTAKLNLSYCTITAPISGYSSNGAPTDGNYITGGSSPVSMGYIYDISSVTANFNISDVDYAELMQANGGLKSEVYRNVPLSFRQPVSGTYTTNLNYVAPAVNQSTGSMLLQGSIPNPDAELRAGMYCDVKLPYGVDPQAVMVKDISIATDQLGKYMYTVNDSNKVVYTPVEVGDLYNDSLRVVTKGIRPGQRYVTKALLKVRRGETIKPVLTK